MSNIMTAAKNTAGYREMFAIEHGNKQIIIVNGHTCYKFTYSNDLEYQDANGATFDTVTKKWID